MAVSYDRVMPDTVVEDRTMASRFGSVFCALQSREQVRYLAVAGSTSLGYLALVAVGLANGLPYMLAILAAQAITITVAFPTYRRLIFRSRRPWRQDLPRFVAVWSGGFVAGIVVTPGLVEFVGMAPLVAQVVAVVGVAVLSYLGHRYFSFARSAR